MRIPRTFFIREHKILTVTVQISNKTVTEKILCFIGVTITVYIDLDNYASNCVVKVNIKVVTKHRKILVTHFLQVTENLIKIVSEILLKVKTKFTAPHQR